MRKFFIWFVIGKITLDIWSALLPQEQALRIAVMAKEFVELQSCSKVAVDIDEGSEYVIFTAECSEVRL